MDVRSRRIALLVTVTVLALLADPPPRPDRPGASTPVSPAQFTPGQAALRATLDPESGGLAEGVVSPKTTDPELENALSRSTAGLVEVHHPEGYVSVHLQGRFHNASIARLDDGKLSTACVHDPAGAADFRCGDHAAPPVLEVR